jgi:hypothetical protein
MSKKSKKKYPAKKNPLIFSCFFMRMLTNGESSEGIGERREGIDNISCCLRISVETI